MNGGGEILNKHTLLRVFSGNANPTLAEEIASHLGISLGKSKIAQLNDGETRIEIDESVRGKDVFIVQPTCPPVNETIMELLIMVDALKRASTRRITVVMPYYGYARQDRKTKARESITAKMVANILTEVGVDRVVCMDLHAAQIQGFFDIPMDHLTAIPILAEYFKSAGTKDAVVVSPDFGGVTRARELAERIGGSIAMLEKKRLEANQVLVSNVIGNVEGKNVIMIDDMIDTAGTIGQGACFLSGAGAKSISVCCTHPLFSGTAVQRLKEAPIQEVIVTNTIPIPPEKRFGKLKVLSVGKLLADTILAIHEEQSVSRLFG
jgi:ribose-phosphate pyrophosphokinase